MKVNNSSKSEKEKKKTKKQAALEAEIFKIMEKSLNAAINKALDDVFKNFDSFK